MPAARNTTPVDCPVCHKIIGRKADLPRHMRVHDEHKEALMHACPFPNCDYKTLQKSNVQTHIRTHTGESSTCPHPGCPFATTDPGSLTRHRKQLHNYKPKARRNHGGKAARRSVAAPYPSAQFVMPKVEIPTSLNLNDPTFSELEGLIPCDALSPAESSDSGIPQSSGEFTELTWERLFPDHSAESSASVYDQPARFPVPTNNNFQPPPVPADLSTLHMPQFDPALFPDVKYQQPVPDVNFQSQPVFDADFQYQPVSGNDQNTSLPAELDEFLLKYGSGFFEGRCEYPDNTTYSTAQPSFTNEHNV